MRFFQIISYLCISIVIASFLGFLHPLFDSLSVFRQYLMLSLLLSFIIAVFVKEKRLLVVNAVVMIIVLFSTFSLTSNYKADKFDYSLYQKNLSFRLAAYDDLITDIKKTKARFITLQEVTKRHQVMLAALRDFYPYQHHCEFGKVGGVAILSKIPFDADASQCINGAGMVHIKDKTNKFWLISIHLHWPWPFKQDAQLAAITKRLATLKGPKIIGGDFNMVKWSHKIKKMSHTLDIKPLNEINYSFFLEDTLPIAIDQILLPKSARSISHTRDLLGSDHKGVYAEFMMD